MHICIMIKDCSVSTIMPMEEVPGPFRKSWGTALAKVLRRTNLAILEGDEVEIDRSLKWLLALPKLLLREPRRGGERGQGSGELAARFEAVQQASWGSLLPLLRRDEEAVRKRRDKRRQGDRRIRRQEEHIDPVEAEAKLRKTVLSLIGKGQVGRARRRVVSFGVADIGDPVVREAVKTKYPARSHEMPDTVLAGTCLEAVPGLRDTLLNLAPGVSAGFGALKHEHLRCAAQQWEEGEEEQLEQFSLAYLNGKLPPWLYKIWGSASSVPLFKTVERDPTELRPVGIKASLVRTLHRRVVLANKGALREYLEPCQVALMPAGGAVLSHTVRQMLELNPAFVCVALDVQNAHNAMARAAVVKALEAVPELRHLAQHAAICLAAHHAVESGGEEITKAGQGVTQGEASASGLYCVGWHKFVLELNGLLQLAGGLSIFGNDDGYAIGPAEVVFPAVERFRAAIREHCGLNLRLSKSLVNTSTGEMPPGAPEGMELAGTRAEEGGPWLSGFRCYGVYIGSDTYVRHMLRKEAEQICSDIDKVMLLLRQDSQAAWILLSSAMAHQLDYSLTLQYPRDMLESARMVDSRLWTALEQLASQPRIPRGEEGLEVECVLDLPGVPSLQGRSYQRMLVAQPIKLGGLGLRSLEETRFPAFLGGLEQALPYMVAGEVCPVPLAPGLQAVIGSFAGQGRWRVMLEANTRTAVEFREAWSNLSREALEIWNFLVVEPSGALADSMEGVGGSSMDGSTRTKLVQQREGLRHQILEKGLKNHADRDARPVFAYQNVADDKCAGSWLLAIPKHDNQPSL